MIVCIVGSWLEHYIAAST